jgi:hypothetical protein
MKILGVDPGIHGGTPFREQASLKDRSGTWRIRLAVGLCCPFCDRMVHACDTDHFCYRLRFVCRQCHRDLIEIEHEEDDDE